MQNRYKRRYYKALSEKRRNAAKSRWAKDRERRNAEAPARERELAIIEAENLPRNQGDPVAILQYTDLRTGQVRRWTLRIGDRRDRFTATFHQTARTTNSHGLTWLVDKPRSVILKP